MKMKTDQIGRLRNLRRNLTASLLNMPINTRETTIASLLVTLDHFADNPNDYQEFINGRIHTNE